MFKVGDLVWHTDQMRYYGKLVRPFRVIDRIEYVSGTVDYIIKLGMVTMLVSGSELTSTEGV